MHGPMNIKNVQTILHAMTFLDTSTWLSNKICNIYTDNVCNSCLTCTYTPGTRRRMMMTMLPIVRNEQPSHVLYPHMSSLATPQLVAPNAAPIVKYSQCSSGVNHPFKNLEAASNFEAPKWWHEASSIMWTHKKLGAIVRNLDVRNLCTPRLVPYDPAPTGRKRYHGICGRP
jgi:hypothetical protein